MFERIRVWWRSMTTKACDRCGEPLLVTEYLETGRSRKEVWWAGREIELECPHCGDTFWAKK